MPKLEPGVEVRSPLSVLLGIRGIVSSPADRAFPSSAVRGPLGLSGEQPVDFALAGRRGR